MARALALVFGLVVGLVVFLMAAWPQSLPSML